MSGVARKIREDVGMAVEAPKPTNSGDLRFYNGFPLKGCAVGETVELVVTAKITSVHQDKYSSGVGFEVKGVKKYK